MIIINPTANQNEVEKVDITAEQLVILKNYITYSVNQSGSVDVVELMNARRNDKSGQLYWQMFTDQMWLDAGQAVQNEFAAEVVLEQ